MTTPFVPIYRQFPTEDAHNLERQLVNFHVQTNTALNSKTIGTFDLNIVPDGERWFPATGEQRQRDGQRLVIQITDSTLVQAHGIVKLNMPTRLYGMFTDGSSVWWPLPYVDVLAVNNQIALSVNSTSITVTKGAGAPPAITSGIVILEYV